MLIVQKIKNVSPIVLLK